MSRLGSKSRYPRYWGKHHLKHDQHKLAVGAILVGVLILAAGLSQYSTNDVSDVTGFATYILSGGTNEWSIQSGDLGRSGYYIETGPEKTPEFAFSPSRAASRENSLALGSPVFNGDLGFFVVEYPSTKKELIIFDANTGREVVSQEFDSKSGGRSAGRFVGMSTFKDPRVEGAEDGIVAVGITGVRFQRTETYTDMLSEIYLFDFNGLQLKRLTLIGDISGEPLIVKEGSEVYLYAGTSRGLYRYSLTNVFEFQDSRGDTDDVVRDDYVWESDNVKFIIPDGEGGLFAVNQNAIHSFIGTHVAGNGPDQTGTLYNLGKIKSSSDSLTVSYKYLRIDGSTNSNKEASIKAYVDGKLVNTKVFSNPRASSDSASNYGSHSFTVNVGDDPEIKFDYTSAFWGVAMKDLTIRRSIDTVYMNKIEPAGIEFLKSNGNGCAKSAAGDRTCTGEVNGQNILLTCEDTDGAKDCSYTINDCGTYGCFNRDYTAICSGSSTTSLVGSQRVYDSTTCFGPGLTRSEQVLSHVIGRGDVVDAVLGEISFKSEFGPDGSPQKVLYIATAEKSDSTDEESTIGKITAYKIFGDRVEKWWDKEAVVGNALVDKATLSLGKNRIFYYGGNKIKSWDYDGTNGKGKSVNNNEAFYNTGANKILSAKNGIFVFEQSSNTKIKSNLVAYNDNFEVKWSKSIFATPAGGPIANDGDIFYTSKESTKSLINSVREDNTLPELRLTSSPVTVGYPSEVCAIGSDAFGGDISRIEFLLDTGDGFKSKEIFSPVKQNIPECITLESTTPKDFNVKVILEDQAGNKVESLRTIKFKAIPIAEVVISDSDAPISFGTTIEDGTDVMLTDWIGTVDKDVRVSLDNRPTDLVGASGTNIFENSDVRVIASVIRDGGEVLVSAKDPTTNGVVETTYLQDGEEAVVGDVFVRIVPESVDLSTFSAKVQVGLADSIERAKRIQLSTGWTDENLVSVSVYASTNKAEMEKDPSQITTGSGVSNLRYKYPVEGNLIVNPEAIPAFTTFGESEWGKTWYWVSIAEDVNGNVAKSPVRSVKIRDHISPQITIVPITDEIGVGKPVVFKATVSDNYGLEKVIFDINGLADGEAVVSGRSTTATFTTRSTTESSGKNIQWTATVIDKAGLSTKSDTGEFTIIDSTKPEITSLRQLVGGRDATSVEKKNTIILEARATDNVGVSGATFYIKDDSSSSDFRKLGDVAAANEGEILDASIIWDSTLSENIDVSDQVTWYAEVYDDSGNTLKSSEKTFEIDAECTGDENPPVFIGELSQGSGALIDDTGNIHSGGTGSGHTGTLYDLGTVDTGAGEFTISYKHLRLDKTRGNSNGYIYTYVNDKLVHTDVFNNNAGGTSDISNYRDHSFALDVPANPRIKFGFKSATWGIAMRDLVIKSSTQTDMDSIGVRGGMVLGAKVKDSECGLSKVYLETDELGQWVIRDVVDFGKNTITDQPVSFNWRTDDPTGTGSSHKIGSTNNVIYETVKSIAGEKWYWTRRRTGNLLNGEEILVDRRGESVDTKTGNIKSGILREVSPRVDWGKTFTVSYKYSNLNTVFTGSDPEILTYVNDELVDTFSFREPIPNRPNWKAEWGDFRTHTFEAIAGSGGSDLNNVRFEYNTGQSGSSGSAGLSMKDLFITTGGRDEPRGISLADVDGKVLISYTPVADGGISKEHTIRTKVNGEVVDTYTFRKDQLTLCGGESWKTDIKCRSLDPREIEIDASGAVYIEFLAEHSRSSTGIRDIEIKTPVGESAFDPNLIYKEYDEKWLWTWSDKGTIIDTGSLPASGTILLNYDVVKNTGSPGYESWVETWVNDVKVETSEYVRGGLTHKELSLDIPANARIRLIAQNPYGGSTGVRNFEVYLGGSTNARAPTIIPATRFEHPTVIPGTTVNWRLRAYDRSGYQIISQEKSFDIIDNTPPEIVGAISQDKGRVLQGDDAGGLKICAKDDGTLDKAELLVREVSKDGSVGDFAIESTLPLNFKNGAVQCATFKVPTRGIPFETVVQWKVKVTDSESNSADSPLKDFVIGSRKPTFDRKTQSAEEIVEGGAVDISVHWTDDYGLSAARIETDESGSFKPFCVDDHKTCPDGDDAGSIIDLEGRTDADVSFTWSNPDIPNGTIVNWKIITYDLDGNVNEEDPYFLVVDDDILPVIENLAQTNTNPVIGETLTLSADVSDNVGLERAILETDERGNGFETVKIIDFNGEGTGEARFVWQNTSVEGHIVNWRIKVYDVNGNEAVSNELFFDVEAGDVVTPTSSSSSSTTLEGTTTTSDGTTTTGDVTTSTTNVPDTRECPVCNDPTEWTTCSNDVQTRTISYCGEDTNFVCVEKEDVRSCEVDDEVLARLAAFEAIEDAQDAIDTAEIEGRDVGEAKKLLVEAQALFNLEEFVDARERAIEAKVAAETSTILTTTTIGGDDSGTGTDFVPIVVLVIGLVLLGGGAYYLKQSGKLDEFLGSGKKEEPTQQ